jgi:hypothetical protein
MLSEINQTQKDKYYMFSLICGNLDFKNVHESRKGLDYLGKEKGSAESGKRNKRWLGSEYDENTL